MILGLDEYRRVLETVPIVCVDGLIVNRSGEVLLVKRLNEPLKGAYWIPGGRVHKGETLAQAVHRKMKQELGVAITIGDLVGAYEERLDETAEKAAGGVHVVGFIYQVKLDDESIILDQQSSDWGWFPKLPALLKDFGWIHLNEAIITRTEDGLELTRS